LKSSAPQRRARKWWWRTCVTVMHSMHKIGIKARGRQRTGCRLRRTARTCRRESAAKCSCTPARKW
jgi:hypothetical protein